MSGQYMARTKNISVVFMSLISLLAGCDRRDHSNVEKGMGNIYEDQLFGLTISKPDSWEFITSEESRERISSTKLKDENIKQLVLLFASRPIVVMVKSRNHNLLPNIQITVNPHERSPDILATDVLWQLSKKGPEGFKDYSIINQPTEIVIDGHKAAYMKAHYTGEFWGDDNVYPTSYETWIVPRHGYFFMISAVSSQDEENETRSEIASTIKSIKLQ